MNQGSYDPWSRWHGRAERGSGSGRLSPEDIDGLFTALATKTFVAFDFETTGLSPEKDRVVEIGAVKFRMVEGADGWNLMVEGEYETLVHPQQVIPPEASAIHGISDLDVSQAPYFKSAAAGFLGFVEATVLVAHNAPFDMGFLLAETRRAGLPEPLNPAYDTRILAKSAVPGLPSYSLHNLALSFGIPQTEAHRGADDARVCMELFGKCINLLARKLV